MQDQFNQQRGKLHNDRRFLNYVLTTSLVVGVAMISFSVSGFTIIGGFDEWLGTEQKTVVQHVSPENRNNENQPVDFTESSTQSIPETVISNTVTEPETEPAQTAEVNSEKHGPVKQVTPAMEPDESNLSETETPEGSPLADIDVYPVGYGSFKIVIFSDSHKIYDATLADASNTEIIKESYEVQYGRNEFVLKSGSIPRGNYLLTVTDGTAVTEKRVALK